MPLPLWFMAHEKTTRTENIFKEHVLREHVLTRQCVCRTKNMFLRVSACGANMNRKEEIFTRQRVCGIALGCLNPKPHRLP